MRTRNMLVTGAVMVALAGSSGWSATIYLNDFGTVAQRATITIENPGYGGTMTPTYTVPWGPFVDIDGDSLAASAEIYTGFGGARMSKDIYAPVLKKYSNLSHFAYANKDALNYGVGGMGVYLVDESGTVTNSTLMASVPYAGPQALTVVGGANPVFNNAKQFRVTELVGNNSGALIGAHGGNWVVSADELDFQSGDNVYIYKNDWGTASQRSILTGPLGPLNFGGTTKDTDQDNLANGLSNVAGGPDVAFTVQINAPSGFLFNNIVGTMLDAYGDAPNYGTAARLELSYNGLFAGEEIFTDTQDLNGAIHDVILDSSANSLYQGLSSVWLRARLQSAFTGHADMGAVFLEAEIIGIPEPGTVSLLGLAGLIVYWRSHKMRRG